MKKRILFGAAMIAFMAGLLWLDWWLGETGTNLPKGLPVAVLFVPLLAVAFIELARFSAAAGVVPLIRSGLFGTIVLGTWPFWWQMAARTALPAGGFEPVLLLGMLVLLIFAEQMIRHRTADALRRIACTLLAIVYLGVGGALVLAMRVQFGVPVLVLFLVAVKFTDIGAYLTGSAIGRHKMIPWLSPGKSWEGLAGGLAAAAGMSMLVAWVLRIDSVALWEAAVFGAVVGAAGQFADLCESLLKRSVSAKDSGSLVPEYGGVLDILDSPLLAAPIAYLALLILA